MTEINGNDFKENMQKNNNGLHRGYFAKKLGKIKQLYRSFK